MDFARIQEWCNNWCTILNPNKTNTLVVSRSRTVSPPDGDFFLSEVSIRAGPNLDIVVVKFDSSSHSPTRELSRVSQRIGILRSVKHINMGTSVLLRC